jgi:hypothetical protein
MVAQVWASRSNAATDDQHVMTEQDEAKALKKRVRELEKALADTHMKELARGGVPGDGVPATRLGGREFKKKAAMTQSERPKSDPR